MNRDDRKHALRSAELERLLAAEREKSAGLERYRDEAIVLVEARTKSLHAALAAQKAAEERAERLRDVLQQASERLYRGGDAAITVSAVHALVLSALAPQAPAAPDCPAHDAHGRVTSEDTPNLSHCPCVGVASYAHQRDCADSGCGYCRISLAPAAEPEGSGK